MSVCLSVCLSVPHKPLCIETAERIELIWRTGYPWLISYIVLQGNSGISKNKGILPSETLSQTLDLEKFRHDTSTVASVVNLVRSR